jgi:hypothetical protein
VFGLGSLGTSRFATAPLLAISLLGLFPGSQEKPAPAASSFDEGFCPVDKLTDHLYVISGDGGNVAVLVTDDGALVVDAALAVEGVETYIPGHGTPTSRAGVIDFRRHLVAVRDAVRRLTQVFRRSSL